MRTLFSRHRAAAAALILVGGLASGCSYNKFTTQEEAIKAQWGQVDNQLQRRNDLVPNLVETVKGYAKQEQDVLVKVTEARSRVAGAGTPAEKIQASNELSGALSRLLVVAEQYPNLRANQAFQDLRVALEGTENRITVARNRYVQTVAEYNVKARSFPTNLTAMMFGYKVKPNFTVANEAQISVPPSVNFDKAPASAPR